jgi:branched-chain amino acid transport system substrate-binding protein
MPFSRLAIVGLVLYGIYLGAGVAGLGRRGAGDEQLIKVVSSLPRTGSARQQTDAITNGIRMAFEEADYRAGDFRLEYLDWDDATAAAANWTAEGEAANADAAAKDPDVMVFIGPFNSGAAKISMPILNIAGVLMISPATTWPGLTKPGLGDFGEPDIYRPTGKVNFTRVVPGDDLQGTRAANWAKELGIKKVYVLDDNEVYGRGIATIFRERCQQLGLEVLGHESIDVKAQEFRSLMTSIKALGPDLIYFGGTTQSKGGQIAKDMIGAGLDAKFMGPDGCYEQVFITSAGEENVNGRAYITFGGLPPERLEAYMDRYYKRYDQRPDGYAVYGYECGRVALEAIRRANKKERAAIVEAALSLKDFDGTLGRWSFDKNGDISLEMISGFVVEDGKFKFVKLLGPGETK